MPFYVSINHCSYKHNVRYTSGNHILPWLVPPPPIQIGYRLNLHVSVRFVASRTLSYRLVEA